MHDSLYSACGSNVLQWHVSTVVGQLFHQGLIEEKAWDALVTKVRTKIRSITNRHDLVLRGIEQKTHTFVDVITKTIKPLRTVSANGMAISRVTKRVV